MRNWLIKQLGGYTVPKDAHDALNARVAELFSTVTKEDILRRENGVWYNEGRELTEEELRTFKAEARTITQMRLWQILQKDVDYLAYKSIYFNSKNEFDLIGGKMLKYYIDIINTRLKELGS